MTDFFYWNKHNRLGDEIAFTAVLKWFKNKGIAVNYLDDNHIHNVSAKTLFPDGLVRFVDHNDNWPLLPVRNLWIWLPFLRSQGIYAEVKHYYQPKWDVVFSPVIRPDYNNPREFDLESTEILFGRILERWPNSLLVVDKAKQPYANFKNAVVSESWQETFELIRQSQVYVGGDSGTSHYAGAIGHPRMVLLYPDMTIFKEAFAWEAKEMAGIFDPDLANHSWDSTPCCNPENMAILRLVNNRFSAEEVLDQICLKLR